MCMYVYIYIYMYLLCRLVYYVFLHSAKGGAVETGCSDLHAVMC